MQDRLDTPRLLFFQVEQDLGFGIVDNALAVLAVLQRKEVVDVLRCADGGAAVAADDFENLQHELCGKAVAVCADELPALVDEDRLFLGTVLLRLIPYVVQRHKHPHRQQVARQFRDVKHRVLVIQGYVGLLIERARRAMDKSVDDVCQPFCVRRFFQHVVEVPKHRHDAVTVGVDGADQRCVFMGDAAFRVGADQRLVQQLTLFVRHVRDKQGEEDVQPLDFGGEHRLFDARSIQQLVSGFVHLADLHNVDAVLRCRRDLNELTADVGAGAVELMAFQRRDDEHLNALAAHPCRHELHREALSGSAGAENGNVGVLIYAGVKDIHDDEAVVMLVDAQQDAVVVAHLIGCERVAACRTERQYVALRPLKQSALQRNQRQRRQKSLFLAKGAGLHVHIL